ncbi:MAG: M55 family metallopeptidase [Defluviitaleaceae bacterium]|nr:M55 family metallopeptidase [Defluviitaleaceae bacterium]
MKQLIIYADMEGASGIFDEQRSWLFNGTDDWRKFGRDCITSDVLAVCNAAVDFGIDEILLYDGHFAGNCEFNVMLEKLPPIVKVFDVKDRCFDWRRIRGQAKQRPFGIITVGQHARNGEENAYFPHTIQSPPIKNMYINGLHVAEIGQAVLSFCNTPYLANIGCAASMKEALELSSKIVTVTVKDKATGYEPSKEEAYPLIYQGTIKALEQAEQAEIVKIKPPYLFSMELCVGYEFDQTQEISWRGTVNTTKAEWTAPNIEIGLEIFNYVRGLLRKI